MVLLLLFALAVSPFQRPADVVKWSAVAVPGSVTAGSTVDVKVTADVQPGWKLYALEQPEGGPRPLAFGVAAGSPFALAKKRIAGPKPKIQPQDLNFSVDTRYYEREAVFTVPVAVPAGTAPSALDVPLEVTFQACGAELCLRPFTQTLPVRISIVR